MFDVSVSFSLFNSVSLGGRESLHEKLTWIVGGKSVLRSKSNTFHKNKNIFISILQSRFQQKITKLAKTDKDTLLYAADQIGYIYIYNMEKFSPEQNSPRG